MDYLKNRFNVRRDRRQILRVGKRNRNILNANLADTEYVLDGGMKLKG